MTTTDAIDRLESVLAGIGPLAVAVSGGVDSMTLAHVAHRTPGVDASMYHAVSAAVPREATERVRRHADTAGWDLHVVDAGETSDERYVANPVDRCFYCKTNLYGFVAAATALPIASGTNTDDLGDYRPGLLAAEEYDVHHPLVEAGIDKPTVRSIARQLGLVDVAELPAAPCLSSRIETGIRVTPKRLSAVDVIERHLRERVPTANLRCRIRAAGVVIEVDEARVAEVRRLHQAELRELLSTLDIAGELSFEPYHRGGAFLREQLS